MFADGSAANKRTKDHKHGWAPTGERPIEYRPRKWLERLCILLKYTSRGYIAYEIIQGVIIKELFLLLKRLIWKCLSLNVQAQGGLSCLGWGWWGSVSAGSCTQCRGEELWYV